MAANDITLGIKLRPELDVTRFNTIIDSMKSSLGVFARSVKPIDGAALAKGLDEIKPEADDAGEALEGLAKKASTAAKKINEAADQTDNSGGKLKSAIGGLGSIGAGGLGLASVGVALGAVVTTGVKANAEMETFETQIGTLIKGTADFKEKYKNVTDPLQLQAAAAQEAKGRLAELNAFGASTPFELPQIAAAEKTLIGFGLTGKRAMELTGKSGADLRTVIGDVSAGVGVDFQELAVTFGKFSTGATGEAIARLQELGVVTKEELTKMGVQFDKAGSLVSPVPQALTAAVTIAQQKFGGGMDALSQTFEGRMSTLADIAKQGAATITGPIFEILGSAVEKLNAVLSSDAFQSTLKSVGAAIAPLAGIIIDTLGNLVGPLSSIVTPLAQMITTVITPLGSVIGLVIGFVGQLVTALSGPLASVLDLVGGLLVAFITPLSDVAKVVFPILLQVLTPILQVFTGIATGLQPLIGVIGGVLGTLLPTIAQLASVASLVVPILTTLAPTIIKIVSAAAELVGILLTALTPILNVVIGVVGAVAEVLSGALGVALGAVSDIILTIVGGPITLLVGALNALGIATEDQTSKELKLGEAQQKSLDAQKKANETAQQRSRSIISLASEYEKLGTKANRSVEEEKRLGEVQRQLNTQYPGLISSTRGFSENLNAVQKAAQDSHKELGKLGAEMLKIEAQSREVAARMAVLKVNAAEGELRDAIKSAASTWGIGGGNAADAFLQAFGSKIRNAQNEVELTKALNDALLGLDTLAIDEKIGDQEKLKIGELIGKLQAARQGVLDLRKASSEPVSAPAVVEPPPSKGGLSDKEKEAQKKKAEELKKLREKLQEDITKAESDARIAAIEDNRKRELIALDEKAKAEIAETLETYKELGEKDAEVQKLLTLQKDLAARERTTLIQKLIKTGGDEERKAFEETTKQQVDQLKADEEVLTGADAATAARRGELRRQRLQIEFSRELGLIARATPQFKTAFAAIDEQFLKGEIDGSQRQAAIQKALLDAIPDSSALQKELAELGSQALDGAISLEEYHKRVQEAGQRAVERVKGNEQARLAILKLTAAQEKVIIDERRTLREKDLEFETKFAALLGEAADQARATATLESSRALEGRLAELDALQAELQERLAAGKETEESFAEKSLAIVQARSDAKIKADADQFNIHIEYLRKTNDAVAAATAFQLGAEKALKQDIGAERRQEIEEERAELQEKSNDLLAALRDDEISYEEYYQKLDELRKRDTELAAEAEKTKASFTNLLLQSTVEAAKAFEEEKAAAIGAGLEKLKELSAAGQAFSAEAGLAQLQLLRDYGLQTLAQMTSASAAMIQAGEFSLKALGNIALKSAFDLADSEINILTPVILAKAMALLGPVFGVIAGAAAITLVKAGLGAARGAIKLNKGGVVPGDDPSVGDVVPAMLTPTERVFNPAISKRNKPLFDHLHNGGTEEQWFDKKHLRNMLDKDGRIKPLEGNGTNPLWEWLGDKLEKLEQTTQQGLSAVAKRFKRETSIRHKFGEAEISGKNIKLSIVATEEDELAFA